MRAEDHPVIFDRAPILEVDANIAAGNLPGRLIDDQTTAAAVLKINTFGAETAAAYRAAINDRAALRQKDTMPVAIPAAPADRAGIGDIGGAIVSGYSPKTGYRRAGLVGDGPATGKLDRRAGTRYGDRCKIIDSAAICEAR